MKQPSFASFFQAATGNKPYPYQCRLACGERSGPPDEQPLAGGVPCASRLIEIPTGLGKTAAVTLAWLWNRVALQCPDWPRRLVYCLPMRTLVEQTRDEIKRWVENLATAGHLPTTKPRIVILMGGEDPEDKDWDIHPEEPAILIGTQDMLLSRALNRGYGMSRNRWPMHFALLNNDCLWVMDEVQLMGSGLAATTQLQGFRRDRTLGAFGCQSWWMSATLAPDWLATVDFPASLLLEEPLRLTSDKAAPAVSALRCAPKALAPAEGAAADAKAVATFVSKHRNDRGLNLVVVNTVPRARDLHKALIKALPKGHPAPLLLHSQFRPDDRQRILATVRKAPPGAIVVSTQVVEAGVDLSCHTLFTELAPWSSLVQRFGRCNRWLDADQQPHFADARIYWFDLDPEKHAAPYEPEQLLAARDILSGLHSAALRDIESIPPTVADRPRFRHVVRRKDLIELFDTTPDLAGADLDIDRFIRDADASHVSVFWRGWSGRTPNDNTQEPAPRRAELCSTGIGDLKSLLGKQGSAWRWSFLDHEWQPVKPDALIPGQTYLLHASQGGYHTELGWTGDAKEHVQPVPPRPGAALPPSNEDEEDSQVATWQTIAEHTDQVCAALDDLIPALADFVAQHPDLPPILREAARWHDWGKAHAAFQAGLQSDALAASGKAPAAKAPKGDWLQGRLPAKPALDEARRRHFRHELASALGLLHPQSGFPLIDPRSRDLAAYLVAAHHGKVRLSIRSLPGEWAPPTEEQRFARGVWDEDKLPATDLGGGTTSAEIVLSLEPMELGLCETPPFTGQPSWAERTLTLRDTLGPFLLAYLEALLRAADARASRSEAKIEANQAGDSLQVAEPSAAEYGAKALTPAQQAIIAATVEEGLRIQNRFRPEPLYKTTGKGHFDSQTVDEIRDARDKPREEPT